MTCANCEALRERLRIAERELGLRRREGAIGALIHHVGLEPAQAVLVLDMYEAGGRCVSQERLIENCGTTGRKALSVQISRLKARLGGDVIITFSTLGYGLAPAMVSRVLAVIEPPSLQDARLDLS